jgi:anti-anti-sigma regulatory factor
MTLQNGGDFGHEPKSKPGPILEVSNMPELFTYERIDNTLVVIAHGDPFNHRYDELRNGYNEIYRQLSEGVDNLVFDFADFTHFGSTFITVLIKLAQKVRLGGGEALLCNLSPAMDELLKELMLLENVGANFFLVPHPDRASALQTLLASKHR